MSDLEEAWRQKSDEELADRVKRLAEYSPEGQRIIRAELLRRGLAAPPADEGQLPEPTAEWAMHVNDRLEALERRLPNSSIIHPSFWRRALTVVGYNWAIMGTIYAVIFGIFVIFAILAGILEALA